MDGDEDRELEEAVMNGRMCIVSRRSLPAEALIRFVAGPDGRVVPDLKRRLPGRGAHIEARRAVVETALKRKLLPRALKRELSGVETLPRDVEALLVRAAAGALALARKAGQITTGAAKVDAAVRSGKALAVLHASDGAPTACASWTARAMPEPSRRRPNRCRPIRRSRPPKSVWPWAI